MKLASYKKRQLILQYLFRVKFKSIYFYYIILKILVLNKFITPQTKILAIFYLINFNKIVRISLHKNICLITGSKRSVFNFFKLNRLSVIENSSKLFFPGVKKTIW